MENEQNGSSCITLLGERSRTWWIYLATSAVIYVACLSLSILCYGIKLLISRQIRKTTSFDNDEPSNLYKCSKACGDFFRQLLLGDTIYSKIFISFNVLCNLIFLGIAIARGTSPDDAEIEIDLKHQPEFILELVVNAEMLLYAVVRFLASSNIVLYWFSPYTIVDVLTLPQVIVSAILGVDWIGLRSLRFIWLTDIIKVVQFIPYVSNIVMDAVSVLVYVVVLWLTATGIIHLLETQGDPWDNFKNAQCNPVLLYAYMIMVTLSTVGYGDITPKTVLGRTFITFFIIGGLALFAAMLPRLADITSTYYQNTQFTSFDTSRVPRHVIVCGFITDVTANDFLKDFLHPDRGDKKTHILFLNPGKPDAKLKSVIRYNYTRVQYLDGSVLNSFDLCKAKIKTARAIFILANKNTHNPSEEDHANLFRLVSIKNTTIHVPVIIQVLHSFSKRQVYNIDGWNKFRDVAICLNELKLGLLAQNCLCPGFSTLIANMFYTSDFTTPSQTTDPDTNWFHLYTEGASNEIYSSYFSNFFFDKNFHEAARFCFKNFKLMLLAIEHNRKIYVNPSTESDSNMKIDVNTIGYFIAQNREQIVVVENYSVHSNRRSLRKRQQDDEESPETALQLTREQRAYRKRKQKQRSVFSTRLSLDITKTPEHFEASELFYMYVSEPNQLVKAILNPEMAFLDTTMKEPDVNISDHIVLCIFSTEYSPLLGLHSFLNPLRNKSLPPECVKPVVIVCNKEFIQKEWAIIRNIPEVYVVVGSPLRWSNLMSADIGKASVCVVLTAPSGSMSDEQGINDKEPILCTLSLKNAKKHKKCNKNVQIITDLIHDSNVQFLDIGDEDQPDERIYKTQLFACGEAFSASMFDSVTSSVYHNPGIMQIVESLIYPSENTALLTHHPIAETGFAGNKFVELYESLLDVKTICLGLFRKFDEESPNRFVITSPDPDLELLESDIAFVITQKIDLRSKEE